MLLTAFWGTIIGLSIISAASRIKDIKDTLSDIKDELRQIRYMMERDDDYQGSYEGYEDE